MNRHDYSINIFGNISSEILELKNITENTTLSTENMEYSWETGIVNNVVTWFDVQKIHILKAELQFILQRADGKLETVGQIIGHIDETASGNLENISQNIKEIADKYKTLNNMLNQVTPAPQFKRKG
ncbi:MAG: hypothetical protein K2K16_11780 [Ruminococcus sp.]|nr:hypothetical protein [Ruminococcus sp.]